MFNEKRIDEIRKRIQTSTILETHEKSDWLNLLELMNDKQLSELEEILGATSAVGSNQPISNFGSEVVSKTEPISKMPPLSHIANIPTDVTMTHSVPVAKTYGKQAPVPQQPIAIPQTPKPIHPPTPAQQPKKPFSPIHSSFNPSPVTPPGQINTTPPLTHPSKPITPAQPIPTSKPIVALKTFSINDPSELQTLSPTTLRQYNLQTLADTIRDIIQERGYFSILQIIESSQLYKSYLETGKAMLGAPNQKNNPELTLSQAELEFVTDLLIHIRFNSW